MGTQRRFQFLNALRTLFRPIQNTFRPLKMHSKWRCSVICSVWVFSQWRVRGSGPPPPPYQTWRLYGTETVVNRQDLISLFNWLIFFKWQAVLSAPTAIGDHRLRNTWSSLWELNCHKKSSTVLFEPKFGPPIEIFLDTLACERQTFLLVHRRWGTFREEKRLPFAGYGSSPVQKLQAIVGLSNTCFENWTWMEQSSRNF